MSKWCSCSGAYCLNICFSSQLGKLSRFTCKKCTQSDQNCTNLRLIMDALLSSNNFRCIGTATISEMVYLFYFCQPCSELRPFIPTVNKMLHKEKVAQRLKYMVRSQLIFSFDNRAKSIQNKEYKRKLAWNHWMFSAASCKKFQKNGAKTTFILKLVAVLDILL